MAIPARPIRVIRKSDACTNRYRIVALAVWAVVEWMQVEWVVAVKTAPVVPAVAMAAREVKPARVARAAALPAKKTAVDATP
jgi:hypothetical protein